jgi:hypothetical protein
MRSASWTDSKPNPRLADALADGVRQMAERRETNKQKRKPRIDNRSRSETAIRVYSR